MSKHTNININKYKCTFGFRQSVFGGTNGIIGSCGPSSKTLFTALKFFDERHSRRMSADVLEVGTFKRDIKWRAGGGFLVGDVSGISLSIPDESSLSGERRSTLEMDGKVVLITL